MNNTERIHPMRQSEERYISLLTESEIAQFSPAELHEYEDSLKAYRDIKNSIDTALEKGLEQGLERGIEQGKAIGKAIGIEQGKALGIEQGKAMGIEQGKVIGIEQGKAMGIEQGKAEVAKAMFAKGMDVKTISEMTGLPEDVVRTL